MKASYFSTDVQEFIRVLANHDVRYVIVGGEAVIYHGHARLTNGIDFFYEPTVENADRLWDALDEYWAGDMPGLKSSEGLLLIGATVGFVPAVVSELLTGSLNATAWICVIGSGSCCGSYFYFLARAYDSSDFTIVYPVARSLPVLLVGLGDVVLGREVTTHGWLGMSLVVAGCVLVPLRSLRDVSLGRYFNRSTLWMLLTGVVLGLVAWRYPGAPRPGRQVAWELLFMAASANLAYGFWERAMRGGNVVLVVSSSYLTPLLSTIVSSLYLRVGLGLRLWLGCALVVGGAALCNAAVGRTGAPRDARQDRGRAPQGAP